VSISAFHLRGAWLYWVNFARMPWARWRHFNSLGFSHCRMLNQDTLVRQRFAHTLPGGLLTRDPALAYYALTGTFFSRRRAVASNGGLLDPSGICRWRCSWLTTVDSFSVISLFILRMMCSVYAIDVCAPQLDVDFPQPHIFPLLLPPLTELSHAPRAVLALRRFALAHAL
jgi:hypothetical protein